MLQIKYLFEPITKIPYKKDGLLVLFEKALKLRKTFYKT